MESLSSSLAAPRSVDAGRGVSWWTDAWALFMRNPGMWIVLGLLMLVIYIVLSIIPLLGSLAASLAAPVFVASWLRAAQKVEAGGNLEIGDLFSAFQGDKLVPLIVVGAVVLVATVLFTLIVGALGFGAVVGAAGRGSATGVVAALGAGVLALIVGLVFVFAVSTALWFAPALIVFRNLAPVDALKASIDASLKNIGPFVLFSIIYIVAAVVASIPFGLGWIVLVPVLLLTMSTSYRDVFGS